MYFAETDLAVHVERRYGVQLLQITQLHGFVVQFAVHLRQALQWGQIELCGIGGRFIGNARLVILLHGALRVADDQIGRGAAGLELQDFLAGHQSLGILLLGQQFLGLVDGLARACFAV